MEVNALFRQHCVSGFEWSMINRVTHVGGAETMYVSLCDDPLPHEPWRTPTLEPVEQSIRARFQDRPTRPRRRQHRLAPVAAGVFMLVLRPFKVGDVVTAGGVTATVTELGLFGTTITTARQHRGHRRQQQDLL
jgi:hypothetical protein